MAPTRAAGPCHPGTYTTYLGRHLSACPRRRRRARCREIGRKNRKGKKKTWRVKTTSHGHGCNSASASPALHRLFLSSLLPSPSLPPLSFPSPSKVQDARPPHPAALPIVSHAGASPKHFLFHLVFILPCTPLCGLGQPLPKVGSLLFFVPKPVTSDRLASPRLA